MLGKDRCSLGAARRGGEADRSRTSGAPGGYVMN